MPLKKLTLLRCAPCVFNDVNHTVQRMSLPFTVSRTVCRSFVRVLTWHSYSPASSSRTPDTFSPQAAESPSGCSTEKRGSEVNVKMLDVRIESSLVRIQETWKKRASYRGVFFFFFKKSIFFYIIYSVAQIMYEIRKERWTVNMYTSY